MSARADAQAHDVLVEQAVDRQAGGVWIAVGHCAEQRLVALDAMDLHERPRAALARVDEMRDMAERVDERVLRCGPTEARGRADGAQEVDAQRAAGGVDGRWERGVLIGGAVFGERAGWRQFSRGERKRAGDGVAAFAQRDVTLGDALHLVDEAAVRPYARDEARDRQALGAE